MKERQRIIGSHTIPCCDMWASETEELGFTMYHIHIKTKPLCQTKNVNDLKITSPRLFYVDKYDQALEITSKLPELYELKTHNISEQDKM